MRNPLRKRRILFAIVEKDDDTWSWESGLAPEKLHAMLGTVQQDIVADIMRDAHDRGDTKQLGAHEGD